MVDTSGRSICDVFRPLLTGLEATKGACTSPNEEEEVNMWANLHRNSTVTPVVDLSFSDVTKLTVGLT